MIEAPGVDVSAEPSRVWTARGPLAARAMAYARRLAASFPPERWGGRAFALEIVRAAPEHVGLGTGTQLALATARAVAAAANLPALSAAELASRVGRGERSAIGVYGFDRGGFLVDGGKAAKTALAPLIARHDFPDEWDILLAIPHQKGLHGRGEREAFLQASRGAEGDDSAELCRLLLLSVLPALVERDLPVFARALHEFNRKVGEMFAPWQAGAYATPRAAALVDWLTQRGLGAGQTSWGPAVFAFGERDRLERTLQDLQCTGLAHEDRLILTTARNQAASVDSMAP